MDTEREAQSGPVSGCVVRRGCRRASVRDDERVDGRQGLG
jgi:hypothetical protein